MPAMRRGHVTVGVLVGLVGLGCRGGSSGEPDGSPPADAPGPAALVVTHVFDNTPVTAIDFPAILVGETALVAVRLTNAGGANSAPIVLLLGGPNAEEFAIDATSSCTGAALEPGGSCEIVVAFHPSLAGERAASLTIAAEGDSVQIPMSGEAVVVGLVFAQSIDFGLVEIGTAPTRFLTLINATSLPVPLGGFDVIGADFALVDSTCGDTLNPASSCVVSVAAGPTALGMTTGTLSFAAVNTTYPVDLVAIGARRVSVVIAGDSTGDVSSNPSGISCPTWCTTLTVGDLNLHAHATTGSIVAGWSIPTCGTGGSFLVPADVNPITVTVEFTDPWDSELRVSMVGDATGQIQLWRTAYTGFSAASVDTVTNLFSGETVRLAVATSSTFAGFVDPTGLCVPDEITAGGASCTFAVPPGVTGVTQIDAILNKAPGEDWTREIYQGEVFISVDHDGSGNVVATTPSHMVKLSADGATQWTKNLPATTRRLATGPADTVYVVTSGSVRKYDAAGTPLWTVPLDANSMTTCGTIDRPEPCIAVAADGAVVVHGDSGLTRWDSGGGLTWSIPITATSQPGVAVDAAGTVYVAIASAAGNGISVVRYAAADGAEVGTWSDAGLGDYGAIAFDSEGRLFSSTAEAGDVWLRRLHANGLVDYTTPFDSSFTEEILNGIATSGTGHFAWWHGLTDDPKGGYRISALTNAGASVWSLERDHWVNPYPAGLGPDQYPGSKIRDVSYHNGQIVAVGEFRHLWITTNIGWIQAYTP
jgi:hypothetical protein